MCATLLAPLALVDVPPLLDYPNHLARAYVLALGQHDAFLSRMYATHWAILPNLAIDLILPPLLWIMPVHLAGRLLLGVSLLLPVIGTILCSNATFARQPAPTPATALASCWPIAACLVACNGLFLLGFINFQLGIGLALICAALWMARRERHPKSTAAIGAICGVALFFCHLMGLAFFLIMLGAYEAERAWTQHRPNGTRLLHHRAASLLPILVRRSAWLLPVVAVPMLLYTLSAFASAGGGIAWETPHDKLIRAAMPLLNYNLPLDLFSAGLLAGFLLTAARLHWLEVKLRSVIALATLAFLYVAAPFGLKGTGYIDARFAVMFGFLLFAGIRPTLPRRAALPVALIVLVLFGLRTGQVAAVWNAHNRDLAELRAAIAPIPPGSRVLLAQVETQEAAQGQRGIPSRQYLSDGTRLDSHTPALVLIERHAFWTFLFADPAQQPIRLRSPYRDIANATLGIPDVRLLSAPSPIAADLATFPLEGRWSCCYDYVLLLESGARPDFASNNLTLLRKSDYASLFRVTPAAPATTVTVAQSPPPAL
jgi:hypothetical protein